MKKQLIWRPHRHHVATVTRGVVDQHGQGETVDLELCACTAWRPAGARVWHGSPFRRRLPVHTVKAASR